MLPIELYHVIASQSPGAYAAMLALPPFARDIDVSKRIDYMIMFGHDIYISKYYILWTRNDYRHRNDGPAIECSDGFRSWWRGGRRHRIDGPAVVRADGGSEWWVNDLRHRVDGPAVTRVDGTIEWWVDGVLVQK